MKSQVNPAVAIAVIVVVVAVIGFFIMRRSSSDSGYVEPSHQQSKASKADK